MYFIVFLKIFDKYMTIRERVSNIIEKKFKSELIYNKKYLKAERRFNTKESFQGFYIPVILFDSVYRKDENFYPKRILEKYIHNIFWKNIINFAFWGFGSFSWNIRSFLGFFSWNMRKFRFLKYKELFRDFHLPIKLRKYKKFFRAFRFLKYKKNFLLIKYDKFFNTRARKFHFPWI